MKIDLVLLRQISILSGFFGLVAGFITLIPYINIFSFIFLICFIAPIVIYLLAKYDCISLTSVQDGIIIGALSGFISYLAFSVIYIPISILLIKLFGYSANQGIALLLGNANLFILVIVSIFMGVLSATVNAFTGFLAYYVMEFLSRVK
ncbi:hypothetical protein II810_03345 [bacterium]|nr:hypothetical protein [bacterium]